ncbi:MAG: NACHT domain-containing protein [Agriterribacter sp.]
MPVLSFILEKFSEDILGDIFKTAKDKSLQKLKKINKSEFNRYQISTVDIQDSVRLHITSVAKLSEYFYLKGMDRPKTVKDIYINLKIRLSAKKWDYRKKGSRKFYDIKNLLSKETNHLIILGDPGAGKSTTIKRICSLLIFENDRELKNFKFPLLVRLRELRDNETLFERLRSILSISIATKERTNPGDILEKNTLLKNFILEYVDLLGIVILIDGLDEISDKKADAILNEVQELATNLINTRLVLTSRSGAYDRTIDCTSIYEIQPLTSDQIDEFINKWFKSIGKRKKFKNQLESSLHYSTTVKPLDLVLLCTLFDNNGFIPEQPKDVYRKRIKLYIEEWDKENNVKRNSKYSQLDVDGKFYFLCQLSFWLSFQNNKRIYGESELKLAYLKIYEYFNLPKNESKKVLQELETHTGLLITSGYEKIEFYHKTIQEYFTAYYLHELPSIPFIENFPDEFAIATALCPDSNSYLIKLLLNYITPKFLTRDFLRKYLYRINLENIRFKSVSLHIVVLIISYESIFINTEGEFHKFEQEEKQLSNKGMTTVTNTIKSFLSKYVSKKSVRDFFSHYTIQSSSSKGLSILNPKGSYILSPITDLYKEHHALLHKKIFITEDILNHLKTIINSK